jgi:hypothetical protein
MDFIRDRIEAAVRAKAHRAWLLSFAAFLFSAALSQLWPQIQAQFFGMDRGAARWLGARRDSFWLARLGGLYIFGMAL